MSGLLRVLERVLVIGLLLGFWFLGSYFGWWSRFILPSPKRVVETFGALVANGELLGHIGVSVGRIAVGFVLTACLAVPLGIVFGLYGRLYGWFRPLFEFMRNTPPLALVPMLILWFGIGETSKIVLIVLASFFPIFLNTQKGVSSCDRQLVEVGVVFELGAWARFWRIIWPDSLADIVLGLKMGMGYSWRAIIGAEMIAASSGLGYLILDGQQLSRSDVVIVGILVIGTLGLLSDLLFGLIMKWLSGERGVNHGAYGVVNRGK